MKSVVSRRLKLIDMRSDIPPAFALLELWGYSSADVASQIRRSPQQVVYYRSRRTPVPKVINVRLRQALEEALEVSHTFTGRTPGAQEVIAQLEEFTQNILNDWKDYQ